MRFNLAILLVPLLAALASGGVVKTVDGKTYTGEIRFDVDGQITITPPGAVAVRVALGDVALVRTKEMDPPESPLGKWVSRDVGQPALAGETRLEDGVFAIRAAGVGIGERKDQYHFVYQTVTGNGQIVARIARIDAGDPLGQAGIMFRSALDESSPFVAVHLHPHEVAHFASRQRLGAIVQEERQGIARPPAWLKLVRDGQTFKGYCSEDGQSWQRIGTAYVNMPQPVLAGLTFCSKSAQVKGRATFENAAVVVANPPPTPGAFTRGLLLRNGSLVAGHIRSANESVVRIYRERDQDRSIPLVDVAQIIIGPMRPEAQSKVPPKASGVLLTTGDFYEGPVQSIQDGRVKVNSVILGLRRFELGHVSSIVLRDAAGPAGRFSVKCRDGSAILTDTLSIEKGLLVVDGGPAGALRFSAAEVLEIKASAAK